MNIKKPSETIGKKVEVPMEAAMPCKKGTKSKKRDHRARLRKLKVEGVKPDTIPKTKYACIVEAHESTRQRLESSLPKKHEDHTVGKGFSSVTHYNLVHKFILMSRAMKIRDAKAAMDKESKKLETNPAWQLEKVKCEKEVNLEAQRDKRKVHYADGHISYQKSGVRTPLSRFQGRVVQMQRRLWRKNGKNWRKFRHCS